MKKNNDGENDDPATLDNNGLLQLIRHFGNELNVRKQALQRLQVDSSFDKDLGLDSLTRMEILSRVEDYYDVALSEESYSRIETPRDLWREIQNTSPQIPKKIVLDHFTSQQDYAEEIPYNAQTLIEVLDWHVQNHPERTHITLYNDHDNGENISFGVLAQEAATIAAGLQYHGLKPRQTVALMLPTSREYFVSFFAILLAGAIPVPLYPPARRTQVEEHLRRHQRILENCQAVILITVDENKALAAELTNQLSDLQQIISPQELTTTNNTFFRTKTSSQDIAFLQYTSGSTGTPKGVILSHYNLLSNVQAMGERVGAKSSDVYVSWLPLYHDMGLIGAWFGSLYYGMHLVVMPPLSFLARPSRWLNALHRYRGTLTGAPNFAYELCLQRIGDKQLAALDLSSVRCIFNGAEPISPNTMAQFNRKFKPCGLTETAMQPVYGLAECSVGLTFPATKRPPLIDQIDRVTFMKTGRAVTTTKSETALLFPACGIPLSQHEIRIVDDAELELPERQQGRLEFRGPSATSGYYRNPEATKKLFHGDWLDSGDLAYIANGELYITGRIKDIIIHAGRNIYPHELEQAIGHIDGIRNGCVAVFGSQNQDSGTEQLVVLAETKIEDPKQREQLVVQINSISSDLVGSPPDEIALVKPHTVLKTSSGKIRRSACRDLFEQGFINQDNPQNVQLLLLRSYFKNAVKQFNNMLGNTTAWLYGIYAWAVFLLCSIIGWPMVIICPRTWSRPIMRFVFRVLTVACNIKINIIGQENINPEQAPFIFVSNHASYLDSMILLLAIPIDFNFVAKTELKNHIIARLLLQKLDTQFVERFDIQQSLSDSKKLIVEASKNHSLLFFPEGTFTRMPGLLAFRMGAFTTAAATGRPVIPVAIRGTRSILRANNWLPRKAMITVTIGKPIKPETDGKTTDLETTWDIAVKMKDEARSHILKHIGEPDLSQD